MRVTLIASTPYSYLHHRSQKIADGLRAAGMAVTYLEQTYGWRAYLSGERSGAWRQVSRSAGYHVASVLPSPVTRGKSPGNKSSEDTSGDRIKIVSLPLVIPHVRFDSGRVERLNARVFRRVLEREVLTGDATGVEHVAIVDNPFWGIVLKPGDFDRIYYDCIDSAALYAGNASQDRFHEYESRLVGMCSGVFVTAKKLEEHVLRLRPAVPVVRIPNGVDVEWFQARAATDRIAPDMVGLRRPLVGYVGTVSNWVNFDLVKAVASECPGITFAFVGPVDYRSRPKGFETMENVRWLGSREYRFVPSVVQALDACMIPFNTGPIAQHTDPIKLYEYFALGKPVVSTRLSEVEPFGEAELVYLADDAPGFARAVRRAVAENDPARGQQRVAVATEHSWAKQLSRIIQIISTPASD